MNAETLIKHHNDLFHEYVKDIVEPKLGSFYSNELATNILSKGLDINCGVDYISKQKSPYGEYYINRLISVRFSETKMDEPNEYGKYWWPTFTIGGLELAKRTEAFYNSGILPTVYLEISFDPVLKKVLALRYCDGMALIKKLVYRKGNDVPCKRNGEKEFYTPSMKWLRKGKKGLKITEWHDDIGWLDD